MTRDAKVGLLLGLFFIFIIAFLINGLPSLRHDENNNKLTNKMVDFQNEPTALGAKERKVVGRNELSRQTEPVKQQPLEKVQTSITEDTSPRFKMSLPDSTSVVKDVSIEKASNEIKSAAAATVTVKKARPVETNRPKTYIVSEGDNLAVIAKKLYGDEGGNKIKNITKIFEANRELLKSPGEIYVGQELVIPPLTTAQKRSETESIFPNGLFEKVKSIGRRQLSTKTAETKQSRVYRVQEGDSLWKIAAEQLGNGGRYPEISKLNTGILEDEDTLFVGMRLRLPGQ